LSKENTILLPVMILCMDYLFFYDLHDARSKRRLGRIYGVCLLLMLIALAYAGPKYLSSFLRGYGEKDFTMLERLLTEARVVFFYLYLLAVPDVGLLNLSHDFSLSRSITGPPETLLALSGILLLAAAAFVLRKKYNLWAFCIVWYFGNLVIESTIIPLELVFEHRTYLPGVMVFFLLSSGMLYLGWNRGRAIGVIVFVASLLILYGHGTSLRNIIFKTPVSLWLDVVEKSPKLPRAHANLGSALRRSGRLLEAKEAFRRALELKPDMIEPLLGLGQLYLDEPGKEKKALAYLKRAQKLGQRTPRGYAALGNAYLKLGDYGKAEHNYRAALGISPYYQPALNNLGVVKMLTGQNDEAEKIFRFGLRLDSGFEEFNLNLAKLYVKDGRFGDGVDILEKYLSRHEGSRKARVLLRLIKEKAEAETSRSLPD
jgi:Flp pilus assembly protein TadD